MERLLKKIYEGAVKDEPETVGMEKAVSGTVAPTSNAWLRK